MTTTLEGNELFEYLNELDNKFEKLIKNADSSEVYAHDLVRRVLQTETAFLQKYHGAEGKEPGLAFSANGLPFPESLHIDMCQISELTDEEEFSEIGSLYDPDLIISGKKNYTELVEKDWDKQFKKKGEGLIPQTQINIPVTESGNLEFLVKTNWHTPGMDALARNYPIFSKISSLKYQVAFNQLFGESTTQYWKLNDDKLNPFAIIPSKRELSLTERVNDVSQSYLTVIKKGVPRVTKTCIKGLKEFTNFTFLYPTTLKKHKLNSECDLVMGGLANAVLNLGIGTVTGIIAGQDLKYAIAYWGTAATTNILSGTYRWGKSLMKEDKE